MKESEILSECQSFKTEYQDFVDSIIIHDEEGDFDTKQSPDATTSSYGMITIRTKELRVLKVKLGNRGWEVLIVIEPPPGANEINDSNSNSNKEGFSQTFDNPEYFNSSNSQNDGGDNKVLGDFCKASKEKQLIFETPESLLMTFSPVFGQLWNSKLTDKLQQLADLQSQRQ